MGIIKKYNEYVKESKKINEDVEDFDNIDSTSDEVIENELDSELDMESEFIDDEISDESSDEFEEEEEGHQYNGTKMLSELADALGSEVVNGSVEYNGKKINFFSETEMFHVDKMKFKTVQEVIDYLKTESGTEDVQVEEFEEEPVLSESKSYRSTRKFKSFRSGK